MKLVRYRSPLTSRLVLGVLNEHAIIGHSASELTLLGLCQNGSIAEQVHQQLLPYADETYAASELELHSPIGTPPTFRDFMSFEQHVDNCLRQFGRDVPPLWYQQPTFYFSNPYSLQGPYANVNIPPNTKWFDLELEVGAVICGNGSNLNADEAEKLIAGYLILSDWSSRDIQHIESSVGLGPVKAKDSVTSVGSIFVTPDELEPYRTGQGYNLGMKASINGQELTNNNWSTLHWSFGDMISQASKGTHIRAGDLFGSGTVGGGCLLEHMGGKLETGRWLQPQDQVAITIEHLGEISVVITGTPHQDETPQNAHFQEKEQLA